MSFHGCLPWEVLLEGDFDVRPAHLEQQLFFSFRDFAVGSGVAAGAIHAINCCHHGCNTVSRAVQTSLDARLCSGFVLPWAIMY